jgi:hypothetical protein
VERRQAAGSRPARSWLAEGWAARGEALGRPGESVGWATGRTGPSGGEGGEWVGPDLGVGLGFGLSIFLSYFLFFSFLNPIQTKFEFKFEFEFKPHSNKIMHQHECNKKFKLMINFNYL